MGFLLVHERMLESYIAARERFMKPGGKMFPGFSTIYVCPFSDNSLYQEQVHSNVEQFFYFSKYFSNVL